MNQLTRKEAERALSTFRYAAGAPGREAWLPTPGDLDTIGKLKQAGEFPAPAVSGYRVLGYLDTLEFGIRYLVEDAGGGRWLLYQFYPWLLSRPEWVALLRELLAGQVGRELPGMLWSDLWVFSRSGDEQVPDLENPFASPSWLVPIGDFLSLEAHVARKSLAWREMLSLGECVAALLREWLAKGEGHGFLSPRAIWIKDTEIRLSDAGLQRVAGSEPVPEYWAPERGGKTAGPGSEARDVYALGACMVFALSGQPPAGTDAPGLDFLKPLAPETVRALLCRLLSPRPGERPTLARLQEECRRLATLKEAGKSALGTLELQEEIGRGSMGRVYRAWEPERHRKVAVKLLFGLRGGDRESVKCFRREVESGAALEHPHLVKIYRAGEQDRVPYFVMELIRGETLDHYCDRASLAQKLAWFRHLLAAVAYLHQKGRVHRDLKLGNVMIDETVNRAVLIDLGLARNLLQERSLTRSGTVMGTPYFLPPEAFSPGYEAAPSWDVYSLGIILYRMLAGGYPFPGKKMDEVLCDIREGNLLPLPEDVLPGIKAGCRRALSRDPGARYSDAGAWLQEWEAAETGVKADPAGRKIVYRTALATGLVAILLAAGSWWYRGRLQQQEMLDSRRARDLEREGRSFLDRQEYDRAERVLARALGLQQRIRGAHHPATADLLGGMAQCFLFQGRVREAEVLWLQAVILGGKNPAANPAVLRARQGLAEIYLARNQGRKGEALSRATLVQLVRTRGWENLRVPGIVNHLALVYSRHGKYREAERLLARMLEVGNKNPAADPLDQAAAFRNLAANDRAQQRWESARARLVQALDHLERRGRSRHPFRSDLLQDLAGLCREQGKEDEAWEWSRQRSDLLAELRGPWDLQVLGERLALARFLLEQHQGEKAADFLFPRVVAGARARLPLQGEERIQVPEGCGLFAFARAQYPRARRFFRYALWQRQKNGGRWINGDTILYEWSLAYARDGQPRRAEIVMRRCLREWAELPREERGAQSHAFLRIMGDLAGFAMAQQHRSEAECYLLAAVRQAGKSGGEDKLLLSEIHRNLGLYYLQGREWEKAYRETRLALKLDEESGPRLREGRRRILDQLALVCRKLKRFEEARRYYPDPTAWQILALELEQGKWDSPDWDKHPGAAPAVLRSAYLAGYEPREKVLRALAERARENLAGRDAADFYRELVKLCPGEPGYALEEARALYSRGEIDRAGNALKRLLVLHPELLPARLLLARYYRFRRREEMAERLLAPCRSHLEAWRLELWRLAEENRPGAALDLLDRIEKRGEIGGESRISLLLDALWRIWLLAKDGNARRAEDLWDFFWREDLSGLDRDVLGTELSPKPLPVRVAYAAEMISTWLDTPGVTKGIPGALEARLRLSDLLAAVGNHDPGVWAKEERRYLPWVMTQQPWLLQLGIRSLDRASLSPEDTVALWDLSIWGGLFSHNPPLLPSPLRRRLVRKYLPDLRRMASPADSSKMAVPFRRSIPMRWSQGQRRYFLCSRPLPAAREKRLEYLALVADLLGPEAARRLWRSLQPRPVVKTWQEADAGARFIAGLLPEERRQLLPAWPRLVKRWMRSLKGQAQWNDALDSLGSLPRLFSDLLSGPIIRQRRAWSYMNYLIRAPRSKEAVGVRAMFQRVVLTSFGRAEERCGCWGEAAYAYDRAIRQAGPQGYAGIYHALLRMQLRLGRKEKAGETLREFLSCPMSCRELRSLQPIYRKLIGTDLAW